MITLSKKECLAKLQGEKYLVIDGNKYKGSRIRHILATFREGECQVNIYRSPVKNKVSVEYSNRLFIEYNNGKIELYSEV